MSAFRIRKALPLLAAVALAPFAWASAAAACPTAGASALPLGTVTTVPAGAAHSYKISLRSGEGVIVDLATNQVRQITEGRGSCESPTWSPNGRVIMFFRENIGGDRFWHLVDDMLARPAQNGERSVCYLYGTTRRREEHFGDRDRGRIRGPSHAVSATSGDR